MSRRFTTVCVLAILILAGSLAWGACWDDQAFFTVNVRPRVMIIEDRSGSQQWDFPGNNTLAWGNPLQRQTAAELAIKGVLDADSNGTVNAADEAYLGVDIGYSDFYNATPEVPYNNDTLGTHYAKIWQDVWVDRAYNGTPAATTLWTAMNYCVNKRSVDPLRNCRPYFMIMITDGGSNYDGTCSGDQYYADDSYKSGRYMEMNVSWTSRWVNHIPVYWVGMGSTMPTSLLNTLNWGAFFGGTKDPTATQTGDTTKCTKHVVVGLPDCNYIGGNPGDWNLSGYAFIGSNGAKLGSALKAIFKQIQQSGGQTFAMSTLPANFSKGALYYWSSFLPLPQPKWWGSVTALKFDSLGNPPFDSLTGNLDTTKIVWDAGNILRNRDINTDPRTIYTWTGTNKRTLLNDYARILPETLGYAAGDTTNQRKTVRFMFGDSVSGGHTWGWLNDPFHGYTVEVKNPSWIYILGKLSYTSFRQHYQNRPARLYAMVNDGQLHCFNADTLGPSGGGQGGRELWSFVPRHMLTRLGAMRSGHQYTMDGPLVLRHIYAYADSAAGENWYDWRTIIVGGERTGGRYYFAMDVTDPTGAVDALVARRPYPYLMWEVGPSTTNGPENLSDMGYTWSTPTIWKMRIGTPSATHRPDTSWVVVVGGGYDCQDLSKGHFIAVLDAFSGQLIRKLTLGAGGGPVAAPVTLADLDKNGKVDHLYAGDLYGNVWRWDVSDSNAANWHLTPNVNPFFHDPNSRPIYGGISLGPTATVGDSSWIYFGTGDRDNPAIQTNNRFYGLKDPQNDLAFPIANLVDVTLFNNCNTPGLMGWFKSVPADTEAVFTMPVTAVNSDSVYTLGWKYPSGSAVACSTGSAGSTYLYSFFKTCGYSNTTWKRNVASGMAPGEIPHGIDRRGRHQGVAVTTMFNLETYLRGKIVKSWREVY